MLGAKEVFMKFLSTTTLVIFSLGVLAASFVAIATFGTRRVRIKDYNQFRFLFAGMVLVALALSVIGIIDILSTPYSGYQVSADYKVIHVTPNSPAALAGMKEGDFVKEIGADDWRRPTGKRSARLDSTRSCDKASCFARQGCIFSLGRQLAGVYPTGSGFGALLEMAQQNKLFVFLVQLLFWASFYDRPVIRIVLLEKHRCSQLPSLCNNGIRFLSALNCDLPQT